MVTKIGQSGAQRHRHLYIEAWMKDRDLSDQTLGERMDVSRQTVYRWRTQQHRLDPEKIANIAQALGIEPEQLWRPPGRNSIDAMLKSAAPEQVADVAEFVQKFIIRR